VREWAERARIVRLRRVLSAECSNKEAADAAMTVLGDRVVARPTPTLLLIASLDSMEPARLLARAGIRTIPHGTDADLAQKLPPLHAYAVPPRAPRVLTERGDAALAARVREAKTQGFPVPIEAPPSLAEAI